MEMNNHKPIQFLISVVGDGRKLTGRGAVRIWRTGSGCASVDSGPISARQLLEAYSYSRLVNLRKSSVFTTSLMMTEIRTKLCCQSTNNAQNKVPPEKNKPSVWRWYCLISLFMDHSLSHVQYESSLIHLTLSSLVFPGFRVVWDLIR